jgi:phage terminase small subunit
MARPKRPPILRQLEGRRDAGPVVPMPDLGEPLIPDFMSDDAQTIIEFVKTSMPKKFFSRSDTYTLMAFGFWASEMQRCIRLMDAPDFRPTITGVRGTQVPNPLYSVMKTASQEFRAYAIRLGLDPAAREHLNVTAIAAKPISKWDGLLGRDGRSFYDSLVESK